MIDVRQTSEFGSWLKRLKDRQAKVRIADRLERVKLGNLGDHKTLGGGLLEFRITYGPGYRVYFSRPGNMIVVLVAGETKSSQQRDIARAREILKGLEK